MWRQRLKIGIVEEPEPATLGNLQATAEAGRSPGHWVSFSLRNVLAVAGLCVTLWSVYRASSEQHQRDHADLVATQTDLRNLRLDLGKTDDKTIRTNQRFNEEVVPRACYDHDTGVSNGLLRMLLENALRQPPQPILPLTRPR